MKLLVSITHTVPFKHETLSDDRVVIVIRLKVNEPVTKHTVAMGTYIGTVSNSRHVGVASVQLDSLSYCELAFLIAKVVAPYASVSADYLHDAHGLVAVPTFRLPYFDEPHRARGVANIAVLKFQVVYVEVNDGVLPPYSYG